MKKAILLLSSVIFPVIFLSCQKVEDETVPVDDLIERKDIPLTRSQQEFVKSNNKFALEFFKKASAMEEGKSMLVSPISITYALGMVDNGARGNTQKEINEVLGYEGDGIDELNSYCRTMLEQGAAVDPSTTIEIANMAVINKAFAKLKDDFTKTVQSSFEANVLYKDFGKEDVKSMINEWCEEKTHGMIKGFLSEPVDRMEYAHFLNATYFKGIWSSQFGKGETRKETFTTSDGKKKSVNMMHQKAVFNYGQIFHLCSAVCLPYGNQAYRMIVMLPYEGKTLDDLKEGLTPDYWEQLNRMSGETVDVKLPSFECEYGTKSIKDILMGMGITTAFSQDLADFHGMTDTDIYISNVLHKAKIKVDEQGSEAAAVTDVQMKATSAGPSVTPQITEFHADRPFLYAITEVSTGAIFFIGQYTGE